MYQRFNIAIKESCSEKFDLFQPTYQGGFCEACQKEVIDFTSMGEQEIFQYFKNKKNNTCGRFRKSQLGLYSGFSGEQPKRSLNGIGAGLVGISLVSFLSISNSQAQEIKSPASISVTENEKGADSTLADGTHRVNGVVTDETGGPLPVVSIVLKGTSIGVCSDFDGRFSFPVPLKAGDELLFSYVGYETQAVTIKEDAPGLLTMNMKLKMCEMVMMGQVAVNTIYSSQPSLWQRFLAYFK